MNVSAYKRRPATLFDVCERTGLSSATVSRVVNNSASVRPDTRDKVMAVIRELGYVPSHAARALAGKRTQMLGVLFPKIASGFFAEVLEGIDEVTAEHQFQLTAAFSRNRQIEKQTVERFVNERRVDALLLMSFYLTDDELAKLTDTTLPIVLIDRPARGVPAAALPSVTLDNHHGADTAMMHLISHGYKRIAVITGPAGNHDAEQRLESCKAAAKRMGVMLDPAMIWQGGFTEQSGYAVVRDWLIGGHDAPDAIFSANDTMALGAIEALRAGGLSVPDDVAVVGFDDINASRHMQLTTVRCPMRDMGRIAANLAIERITTDKKVVDHLLPTELVIRNSCGVRRKFSSNNATALSKEYTDMTPMQRLGLTVMAVAPLALGQPGAAGENDNMLLANPGFELPNLKTQHDGTRPQGWIVFGQTPDGVRVDVTGQTGYKSEQSCRVECALDPDGYQGLFQSVAVTPGRAYRFGARAKNDATHPLKLTVRGQVSIEWKDANDEEIERVLGPDWNEALAGDRWSKFELTATAPPNAVKAHFVITQLAGHTPAGNCAFFVDDTFAYEVTDTNTQKSNE